MPEKSPFAEGNLGMQRYQIRCYMKRFVSGIINAKPKVDSWQQSKNPPITNNALEEQRYLQQKKIAHENLILSKHIHHIKTENRKETTIEYADGWRIAKSGGSSRPVIDCYPTQRRIALNFHNLHSRKHTDDRIKRIRAYQDDRMNKNINNYQSEYNLKTLIKSYNKKKFLMTNVSTKIPKTVLHLGLKEEALRSLKRDKAIAAGLRPPSLKHISPPTSPSKKNVELPKWNNSPSVDRKQLKEEHPIYPSSVELLGPLYGPIDLTKLNKVPASTIKLSSSLKIDREAPTIPQASSLRPQSAGSTRSKIKPKRDVEIASSQTRPKSAVANVKKQANEDWNLYEKIPLNKVSKLSLGKIDIKTEVEENDDIEADGEYDDDVDAFDQYLLERYMAVIGKTPENEILDENDSKNDNRYSAKNDYDYDVELDQEPSFLDLPNSRKVIICESVVPAFAVLGEDVLPVCKYKIRIIDVGVLHTIDDDKPRSKRRQTVSTSAGLVLDAIPILDNHLIRDSNSPGKNDTLESVQSEISEQISKENDDGDHKYLSCSVLIRIPALKALCMANRKRDLVRALSSIKEISDTEGLYECLSDRFDPTNEEALCGLLLSTIGIELHLIQGDGEDGSLVPSTDNRVWACRIELNP